MYVLVYVHVMLFGTVKLRMYNNFRYGKLFVTRDILTNTFHLGSVKPFFETVLGTRFDNQRRSSIKNK